MTTMSVFPPITPFSFTRPGTSIRRTKSVQNCVACRRRKAKCDRKWPCSPCKDRGEAHLCEPFVREPSDRPTGYTHVSDTSILANRVTQLELVISRLLERVDDINIYSDLLNEFKDPLPVFKPPEGKDGHDDDDQDQKPSNGAGHGNGTSHVPMLSAHSTGNGNGSNDAMSRRMSTMSSVSRKKSLIPDDNDVIEVEDMTFMGNGGAPTLPMHPAAAAAVAAAAQGVPVTMPPQMIAHALSPVSRSSFSGQGIGPFPLQPNGVTAPTVYSGPLSGPGSGPYGLSTPSSGSGPLPTTYAPPPTAPPMPYNPPFNALREVPPESESKAPSVHEHDAALALEGLALGREVNFTRAASEEEETPGGALTFSSFIQHNKSKDPRAVLKSFPSVARLPPLIVGKHLLNYYFVHIDFRWRVLHRPTFESQFGALFNRLRTNTTELTRDELNTLAVYAACLAVAVHMLDEEGYQDLALDLDKANALAEVCWNVCYEALAAADWLQVHDVRSCQAIIIAGIYLSSVRKANLHWTLLGSVTKIAMAIGLGGVPKEAKIANGLIKPSPRWQSAIDREVGRRVWFALLELDSLFSMEYGFIYLIGEDMHQTDEPANVNDVDIVANKPVISQPSEVYTDMSYFIQRLRMFYPFRGLCIRARKGGRIHYSYITEAHNELQAALNNSPTFFKYTEGMDIPVDAAQFESIKRETLALNEGADLRLLRLHRYYFAAACQNPRYVLSKKTCLASARRLLEAKRRRMTPYPLIHPHYWAHHYCMFVSTVVMITYLSYALPQEIQEVKQHAESGIEQLRVLSKKGRTDLGDSADTLTSLLTLQLTKREEDSPKVAQPELHKRPHGDIENENWEGWLPADLVALLNESAFGTPGTGAGPPPPDSNVAPVFENLLDDFTLWQ
ncbi:putative transcription factor lepB [Vanrija pseudolonga]|uniref:Transcription factor lepB n=1 Tax=Vanrija pseudolonga TaxID=143232 RepID=A0AAF0Y8D1_9TREE|nr:putative transcription factor lepB [Vanrija pseudolonga]